MILNPLGTQKKNLLIAESRRMCFAVRIMAGEPDEDVFLGSSGVAKHSAIVHRKL